MLAPLVACARGRGLGREEDELKQRAHVRLGEGEALQPRWCRARAARA
jgi:hypothetical protein